MKAKMFFCVALIGITSACTDPNNTNNNNDDSSPGVDEYFKADINSHHWEENDDEQIGAILSDFGSGPIYSLSATAHLDSSHFFYNIPYFYTNDTTWDLSSTPSNMALTFNTDSIYHSTTSGSLHITRSTVGGIEVYTGTFNYVGLELLHGSPGTFANGEFVVARVL